MLRSLLGIPQKALAKRANVSVRELARIEAADVVPTRETAARVDAAFEEVITERCQTKP